MSEQAKTLDDLLKEAEIQRINAEISKIEEEKSKIALELQELSRNLKLPWYKKRQFYQIIAAAILAIPLIWFYVQEFALPLIKSENVKLALENEQGRKQLNAALREFEKRWLELELEKYKQLTQNVSELTQIRDGYVKLDLIRNKLINEYGDLSKSSTITESQWRKLRAELLFIIGEVQLAKSPDQEALNRKIREAKEKKRMLEKAFSFNVSKFAKGLDSLTVPELNLVLKFINSIKDSSSLVP